jgi:hypothetical protein
MAWGCHKFTVNELIVPHLTRNMLCITQWLRYITSIFFMIRLECIGCKFGRERTIPLVNPTFDLKQIRKPKPFSQKKDFFFMLLCSCFNFQLRPYLSGFSSDLHVLMN